MLWAILDNATRYGSGTSVDATGAGIQVVVSVAMEQPARLRIRIADSGPGVPEADRARLFERYQRGTAGSPGPDAPPSSEGSGLGLYVSRALMRAMGGDLTFDTDTKAGAAPFGASFSLWLPAETAQEA